MARLLCIASLRTHSRSAIGCRKPFSQQHRDNETSTRCSVQAALTPPRHPAEMSLKAEQQSQIATAHETAATKPLIPAPQRKALNWLRLSEATVLIDHDVKKARERLERAIKKAWLVAPPGLPQPTLDPNVPLRIQVTSLPGFRLEGRAWLDDPVLHWEASEIECLCKPWTPLSKALASTAATPSRVKIEIWDEDLVRLWGSDKSMGSAATYGALIAPLMSPSTLIEKAR